MSKEAEVLRFENLFQGYVAAQTFNGAAIVNKKSKQEPFVAETHRHFFARGPFVEELPELPIDLDIGHGVTDRRKMWHLVCYALAETIWRAESGVIPWPSAGSLTGRGCSFRYFLRDDREPDYIIPSYALPYPPPTRNADDALKFALVFDEIGRRLADLRFDVTVKSMPRWMKLPQSIIADKAKSCIESRVISFTFTRNVMDAPVYTLDELLDFLGLREEFERQRSKARASARTAQTASAFVARLSKPARREPECEPKAVAEGLYFEKKSESRKRRRVAAGKGAEPHIVRSREIEAYSECIGGIEDGRRERIARIYFRAKHDEAMIRHRDLPKNERHSIATREAQAATRALNASFRPPMTEGDLQSAFTFSPGMKPVSNHYLAAYVAATPEQISEIEKRGFRVQQILPPELANERDRQRAEVEAERCRKREMRELVDSLLRQGEQVRAIVALTGVGERTVRSRKRRLMGTIIGSAMSGFAN